jgi:CheY-like chemotaxis protein
LNASYLKSEGHEVVTAVDGSDDMMKLSAGTFDLVVSDIEMPVLDGPAFASHVRRDPRFDRLPILPLSWLSGDKDRDAALAAGFGAYEVKLDAPRCDQAVA